MISVQHSATLNCIKFETAQFNCLTTGFLSLPMAYRPEPQETVLLVSKSYSLNLTSDWLSRFRVPFLKLWTQDYNGYVSMQHSLSPNPVPRLSLSSLAITRYCDVNGGMFSALLSNWNGWLTNCRKRWREKVFAIFTWVSRGTRMAFCITWRKTSSTGTGKNRNTAG